MLTVGVETHVRMMLIGKGVRSAMLTWQRAFSNDLTGALKFSSRVRVVVMAVVVAVVVVVLLLHGFDWVDANGNKQFNSSALFVVSTEQVHCWRLATLVTIFVIL